MVLLKLAGEQRARTGQVANPIRFSGYRVLKELGLGDGGTGYEDLNAWGERMASTTITSRQVIFFAAHKRYANKTVHVFETFQRVGKESGGGRSEEYEVVLAQWLLENLNENYVLEEDFVPYKLLTCPIAKGVFGFLHWWFHYSKGRRVERNYAELCRLLGIMVYPQLSRIKTQMGRAMDELVSSRYLASWGIQRMVSTDGFKLVMMPGEALLRSLKINTVIKGELPAGDKGKGSDEPPRADLSMAAHQAAVEMAKLGINPVTAEQLLTMHKPEDIMDMVEYVQAQAASNSRIHNPAGLLIKNLTDKAPIPATFVTSRKSKIANESWRIAAEARQRAEELGMAYMAWCDAETDRELEARYPGAALDEKLAEIVAQCRGKHPYAAAVARVSAVGKRGIALSLLRHELRGELNLPDQEAWCEMNPQASLFPN